jgi:hypothetical protein
MGVEATMKAKLDTLVAASTLVALAATLLPATARAGQPGATLEGLILGSDGRAGAGYRVHLIDREGRVVARATASASGHYTFEGVAGGEYALGIESAEGLMAPVAAPPVRVGRDGLVRRDIKLIGASPEQQAAAGTGSYSVGMWWAGLSTASKAWTIVGVVVITGITVAALTDDDEPASPF